MSNEQLLAILKEAREMAAEDRAAPLVDCPVCGHTLDENSTGVINCPFGHYRKQGRTRSTGEY